MALYGIYGSHTVEACPVNNLENGKRLVAFAEADPTPLLKKYKRVKAIPSWNSPRLLIAYAALFFDVVVSIFSSRFNASRSLGRCR